MKYEKCLTCDQLGKTCDGPNFLSMNAAELGLWCNERRKHLRPVPTYDEIVQQTGLSKSTVHGFLNGTHADYRLETARPIVEAIIGGNWDDNPCGNLSNSEKAQYEETVRQLQKEIVWHDEKIKMLTHEMETMEKAHAADVAHLEKAQYNTEKVARQRRIGLVSVSVVLALTLMLIIAALVIDNLNPDIGFFWLDGWLKPNGVTDLFDNWRT